MMMLFVLPNIVFSQSCSLSDISVDASFTPDDASIYTECTEAEFKIVVTNDCNQLADVIIDFLFYNTYLEIVSGDYIEYDWVGGASNLKRLRFVTGGLQAGESKELKFIFKTTWAAPPVLEVYLKKGFDVTAMVNLPDIDILPNDDLFVIDGVNQVASLEDLIIQEPFEFTSVNQSCQGINWREYFIKGVLEIDVDDTYCIRSNLSTPSLFIMDEGAEIIVKSGSTLRLENVNIEGCSNMFRSITVESGATLILNKVKIKDAQYGIRALAGSSVSIQHCSFINNYIGLYAGEYINGVPQEVNMTFFYNNSFSAPELKPGFSGQSPVPGTIGYAGVKVQNVSSLPLNGIKSANIFLPNYFHDLEYGVIANSSNVSLQHPIIEDTEIGVWIEGVANSFHLVGNGAIDNEEQFTIRNCDAGVISFYGNLEIEDALITEVDVAASVILSQNATVDLHDNYIETNNRGFNLLFNTPLNGKVTDNIIDVDGSPNHSSAINANENASVPNNMGGGWLIENNRIEIQQGRYGILYNGGAFANMKNNTVNLHNGSLVTAVHLEKSTGTTLSCNDILGPGTSGFTQSRGIYSINSEGTQIHCNELDDTEYGIQYFGEGQSSLQGNQYGNHLYGLLLGIEGLPVADNVTTIGNQSHHGNSWTTEYDCNSNNNPNAKGARNLGLSEIAQQSKFKVDKTEDCKLMPTFQSNYSTWFIEDNNYPGLESEVCIDPIIDLCPDGIGSNRFFTTTYDYDDLVALENLHGGNYEPTLQWEAARYLYKKLKINPALKANNTTMSNFYSNQSSTSVADVNKVSEGILALMQADSLGQSQLDEISDSIAIYMEDIDGIDQKLFFDSLNLVDSLALLDQRLWFQARIQIQAIAANNIITPLQNILQSQITQVESDNALITDTMIYAQNEREVNTIYLQTLAQGNLTFTTGQSDSLFDIANQCPLLGGNAVLRARGMLRLTDTLSFNDVDLCERANERSREESNVEFNNKVFSIFPNPMNEYFYIEVKDYLENDLQLICYNSLGKQVFVKAINKHSTKINTTELPAGYYQCYLMSQNELLAVEKIIIVK